MSVHENVAPVEGGKKEGLTFTMEDKLKEFLMDTTKAAENEVEKTHNELVTDPSLSEMEQNSLRDVAGMATQQLEDLLKEASGGIGASGASAGSVSEDMERGSAPVVEGEAPTKTLEKKTDEGTPGDLAQADKEIRLLQKKIPNLKGRAYAQAIQRLEDMVQYEGELAAQEAGGQEPMQVERIGDEKVPDVPAGRTGEGEELALTTEEAAAAEAATLDWEKHLTEENEQLEQTLQMIEAAEEVLSGFQETHADSPALTKTEQQYLKAMESDIGWNRAKAAFIENSREGMQAQKRLRDLQPTEENAEAIEQAKAALQKARQNKPVLEAALVAATQKMQEARTEYLRSLEEAGVTVEAGAQEEDGQEENEHADEWSFGHAYDADGGYQGRGIGADQTGPKEKEIFTLNGGGHAEKEEEGFLRQTWKGLSGWLKSLFG